MTREECIDTLKGIKAYYTNERDFSYYGEEYEPLGEGDNEAIDMAIEALEQEPTDCISRQEAINAIPNPWCTSDGNIYNTINIVHKIMDLPSVQPKHGEWKKVSMDKYIRHSQYYYRCSECGENTIGEHNYCPNCGSRMDKQICQEVRYERYIR